MVKAKDLRSKTEDDLLKELTDLRKQLSEFKLNKVSASHQVKLSKIRLVRKDIARVLTVINQQRREKARAENKGKFINYDLRYKKCRRLRRALTPKQKSLKTVKEFKRRTNFPMRVFAVPA